MDENKGVIFLVEEDEVVRNLCVRILVEAGFAVNYFVSHPALRARFCLVKTMPDLVIANWGDGKGLVLAEWLKKERDFSATILMTGRMEELDAKGFLLLRKPISPRDLVSAVRNKLEKHRPVSWE